MRKSTTLGLLAAGAIASASLVFSLAREAGAHCDTMDGPVVTAAKAALEKGDATPVLKWVAKDREEVIRAAFARTLGARKASPEARDVADTWFYETLVRIHRAGEGESYTGLAPAGAKVEQGIEEADAAIAAGDADALAKALAKAVSDGVRTRFARVAETKKAAEQSVEKGREHVAAYVEFIHYVERLHGAALGPAHHHDHEEAGERR